jgi:hypothetical protein
VTTGRQLWIYADEFPHYQQSRDAKPKPKREQHCSAPVEVLYPRRLDGILDHAKPPSKIRAISIGLKVNTQLVATDNGLQYYNTKPLGSPHLPRSLPIASHEKNESKEQQHHQQQDNKTTTAFYIENFATTEADACNPLPTE